MIEVDIDGTFIPQERAALLTKDYQLLELRLAVEADLVDDDAEADGDEDRNDDDARVG